MAYSRMLLTDLCSPHEQVDCLDDLDLPVMVRAGEIRLLELVIPWKNLGSSSAVIKIDGLFLRLRPVDIHTVRQDEAERKAVATKLKRLKLSEVLLQSEMEEKIAKELQTEEGVEKKKEEGSDTFTARLVSTLLANLKVHVDTVHIRYEDLTTDPAHPFAFGVTLDNFSMESTDENFQVESTSKHNDRPCRVVEIL